jgi:acetyltransferase-like isoleucine patch superfamily enzyme
MQLKTNRCRGKGFVGKVIKRLFGGLFFPVHPGVAIINFFVQRMLGVNNEYSWPIHFTSRVVGDVKIGEEVWVSFAVSAGCYIQGNNGVRIGNGSIFAPNVQIISANHDMKNGGWTEMPPIVIGENCWLGANVVILPGVVLGDGCIVGAGSVVTKSFPEGSVIKGVPGLSC